MRYLITPVFLVLLASGFAFAQSGRKVRTPAPTSTPSVQSPADRSEYSESAPSTGPSYSRKSSKKAEKAAVIEPKADTSTSGDDVIKVETNLVTIPVSVYERSGVYLSGLRRNDFKIFDNGQEQEIAYFGTVEQPFSVVLLIDTSGSADSKINQIQNAALEFVNSLRPEDKVMVIDFNSTVNTRVNFTSDRAELEKAIRKISAGGGTDLYGAVETALKKKLANVQGKKAIVLFTDGVDTSGGSNGYEKTLGLAEEGDSVIYSVYYNTYLSMRGIGGGNGPMQGIPDLSIPRNIPGMRAEDYAHGRAYLEELARVTGGKMFRPESTSGGLSAAFEGVANELGNQYTIGYYPQDGGNLGERRTIKVRVNRPAVAVKARDSYIVGAVDAGKTPK